MPLALAWRDNGLPREVGARHGLVLPRLVALIAPLVDRDADGFSPLFTRDCDDGDPGVHPGACEVANGRDDNCNGHTDVAPRYRPDEGSGTRPPGPPPDVYLIVVDALRADFARQERRRAMPALDRFAAQALDFEHAYTPYPSTHRAMLALSTSRPHRFRSTAVPPLPRFLHDAGYDAQV